MRKLQINLLPTLKPEVKPAERFLIFSLTFGRYIVIVTEIVVIACFLARFKLDLELENLHDTINQKKAIVQSMRPQEIRLRLLKTQLAEIRKIQENQRDLNRFLDNLVTLLPQGVVLNKVSLKTNKLTLSATAYGSQNLAQFLYTVRASDKFREVLLGEILVDRKNIQFSLTAIVKPEAFQ